MIRCLHGISAFSIAEMKSSCDYVWVRLLIHCGSDPNYWIHLDTLQRWKLECIGTFGGGDTPLAQIDEQECIP